MGTRARSMQEFYQRLARFVTPEAQAYAEAFQPRPDDVIIATYPKCGTTWMQQIVHGLRTGGDMGFEEITEVTPWIEVAGDLGWDLDADQRAKPRAFKSHQDGDSVPAGCRYIVVLRDPRDALVSFYHFMDGWFLEPGAVSLDEFTRDMIEQGSRSGQYWTHLVSWWRRRHESQVLLSTFEDMKRHLEGEVRRVAAFLDIDHPWPIDIAARQASFDFMKAHEAQFDDHLTAEARNAACGLPEDARSTKVRAGRVGEARQAFSPETAALLDASWREVVEPATGCADYAALLATWRAERG
jgi:hypothetical protein